MKNYLLIHLSPLESNTSALIRTIALAKGIIENPEIQLEIIVASYHPKTLDEKFPFLKKCKIHTLFDASYNENFKQPRTTSLKTKTVRKLWHSFIPFDRTVLKARKVNQNTFQLQPFYDCIISSSDPKTSHIVLNNILKFTKTSQVIGYWGDPFALDITKKSVLPKCILKHIEKQFLKKQDKIVYVSSLTLNSQKQLFPSQSDKMKFYPIPYITPKITHPQNDTFTIAYLGDYHSRIRNLQPFYNAVNTLTDTKTYIIGDSNLTLPTTNNVEIKQRVDNIDTYQDNSDLLVCLLNNSGGQIPGKFYHYCATNKKIIVILDGEQKSQIKDYLASFNRCYFCENDEQAIYNKIKEIKNDTTSFKPVIQLSANYIANKIINDD